MTLTSWLIVLFIIFISGIVKGTTGFGFALFSIPLLVHFIPIKNLVPLVTFFNLFSSLQIVLLTQRLKINKRILLLSFTGIAGVILGSLVLKFTPEEWLELFTALVLICLSILFLTGYRFKIRKIKRGNALAGFISGFIGGSTSVSGPTLALFLTSLRLDTVHFRFTFAWYSIITASVAILDYLKIGVVQIHTVKIFIVSLPLLIVSIWFGKFISTRIPQHSFYLGVIIVSLLAGLFMLFSCIPSCIRFF
jgi:uncharacterized membrane protein YfcA